MNKVVLVVAAHPDDEILGCGGTIARHIKDGDKVHVLILAEGITSRATDGSQEKLASLAQAAKRANEILGSTSLTLHNFPDNRMDSLDLLDVVQVIEKHISKLQPDTVYTHHIGDVNIDHQITHKAVVVACRPLPKHCVQTLLFFETPSSTEWQTPGSGTSFTPNWFVDISSSIEKKLKALEAYESEMRPWPHARSIKALEHLASWRGANIGVNAAEGFLLGRQFR